VKKKNKIRLKAISLVCAFAAVIISSAPLFSSETNAQLLGLIAGSFGAGLLLASLIVDIKRERGKN
jgi:hypothetical protein